MRTRRVLLASLLGLVTVGATVVTIAVANAATNTYEAESASNTLAGGARVANCSACSGGKKVGHVGNNAGTLRFNGVSAAAAGSAILTITYASGSARNATLSVNGGAGQSIAFTSTGSFNTPGTKTVTVTLNAGNNTLKFSNASGWAPDFDKVTVETSGGGGGGGGAPTADELLAKVSSCNQISNGKYKTDSDVSANTVAVCGATGAVFWKSDMDIDCDGQRTSQCNENTDCCFQADTAFHQSDGKPLNSAALPYIVVPSTSSIWNYTNSGVHGASVAAVIYQGKVAYAVVGDTGPTQIIGEGSYALAVALGIDPDPSTGGTDSGVTFIVFTGNGSIVKPIENHNNAVTLGQTLARQFINNN
jgi:hypothetical protein